MISIVPELEIQIDLFKEHEFVGLVPEDFPKQQRGLEILTDNHVNYFVYGGAAGGGKSWTGCTWLLFNCLAYPETRWFIGRDALKKILESTLETFYPDLDEGIKNAVIFLRRHGFETFASCQGGEGHCYHEPTIRFFGSEFDLIRAYELCYIQGIIEQINLSYLAIIFSIFLALYCRLSRTNLLGV